MRLDSERYRTEVCMEKIGMRKIFALVVLVLAVVLVAFAKEKSVESIWAASPLTIDGLVNDWKGDPFHAEKKVKGEYAFRNDSDTLFVFFVFNDLKYLSSIEITGMTLWIDTGGKKDKDLGVKFTKKKISADEYISILEKQQGVISDEQKESLQASAFYFISQAEAVDKKGNPFEQGEDSEAAKGAAFNVSVQQDAVTYEFRVPLKNLTGTIAGNEAEPGGIVGVGFEWGGLTDEMRREYMKGNASGGSGPIGISEGGRGGGGAQGVGFDGASPADLTALRKMTKKYSFWTVVRLAESQ
jgi:hypothetical protein